MLVDLCICMARPGVPIQDNTLNIPTKWNPPVHVLPDQQATILEDLTGFSRYLSICDGWMRCWIVVLKDFDRTKGRFTDKLKCGYGEFSLLAPPS